MLVTDFGIVILLKSEQFSNAFSPMLVTVFGMTVVLQPVINVLEAVSMIALQLLRESKILLSESTEMLVRLVQPEYAYCPILFTYFGMTTLVKEEQL